MQARSIYHAVSQPTKAPRLQRTGAGSGPLALDEGRIDDSLCTVPVVHRFLS